jgi:hypothetical protein
MLSIGCILPAVKSPPRKRLLGLPTRWIEPLESRLLLNAGELDVVFNSTGIAASSLSARDDQIHAMVSSPIARSSRSASRATAARSLPSPAMTRTGCSIRALARAAWS